MTAQLADSSKSAPAALEVVVFGSTVVVAPSDVRTVALVPGAVVAARGEQAAEADRAQGAERLAAAEVRLHRISGHGGQPRAAA